ncbi:hypothetical protein [Raineyella fluvialis]|uniref:Uncharacterized protein n=1 Tax=Raineyella fluvialis TaxID=2662261 RepID=A0A5Q2F646_9ACTN|nr:hypothetical protein [Raineyella fluvialis]QGF22440.1 hypothetical protein Rai3103_00650 [Raineyella fluvialis]
MTWLRHRHAHDLSVTGFGGPKKPFFSSGPGVFYISPNNRWKASKDVLVKKDRMPHLRPAYDAHVAGYPVEAPLAAALAWFTRVFEASGIDPDDPEGTDESVM